MTAIAQTITALPAAPDPVNDTPSTFSTKAAATVLAQIGMVTELNTFIGQANAFGSAISSAAAGGGTTIAYTFDSTTTDADPTSGKLRLSNATQNASTVIRLDLLDAAGTDWTSVLDTFDASTSAVKGQIRLSKVTDGTKWLTFNVTARATPSGYRNITVTNTGSSAANPFVNGDSLILSFTRTGDIGATGPLGSPTFLHVRDEKSSGTAGGASIAGTQDRTLNTVVTNTLGASLASNLVTLLAGTYEVYARAPVVGVVNSHKLTLYNNTDSVAIIVGASCESATAGQSDNAFVVGSFTIASTKDVKLRHYTQSIQTTNGLGNPATGSGLTEVYAEMILRKVA